jgi:hypothetical protein
MTPSWQKSAVTFGSEVDGCASTDSVLQEKEVVILPGVRVL